MAKMLSLRKLMNQYIYINNPYGISSLVFHQHYYLYCLLKNVLVFTIKKYKIHKNVFQYVKNCHTENNRTDVNGFYNVKSNDCKIMILLI